MPSLNTMETLEIHSKDFLIKWINVPENSIIDWQVKPLKKSINFAFYQKKDDQSSPSSIANGGSGSGSSNSNTLTPNGDELSSSTPPNFRSRTNSAASVNQFNKPNDVFKSKSRSSTLSSIGESDLILVKNYNKLVANELVHGKYEATNGGMFAFVFDNSFSKTIAKSVEFDAKIVVKEAPDANIQQHDQHVFESDQEVPTGEVLQSIMLKKRRKKLQGFTKRYFVLNFKRGTLSYFKVDDIKLRGQMPIKESIISANPSNREIIIDSGMEVWYLKTINQADFNAWINAFNAVKKDENKALPSSGHSSGSIASSTELSIVANKLEKLKLETNSPLVNEVHQDILNLLNRSKTNNDHQSSQAIGGVKGDNQSVYSNEYHDAEENFDDDGVYILEDEQFTPDETEDQVGDVSSDEEEEEDDYYGGGAAVAGGAAAAGGAGAATGAGVAGSADQEQQDLPQPTVAGDEDNLYPLPHDPVSRNSEVPVCTHTPPSLLSFVRKNVGKDLSTIAMPVTYNEPTTVLQKFAEMLEYPEIVTNALGSDFQDESGEKVLRIAVFALSYLSSQRAKERNKRKPFTPLLGETYELVREDFGFRLISEKVSHRPPVFAYHVDTDNWSMDFALSPSQKFWGKQSEVTTKGFIVLKDKLTNEEFTWTQPTTMIKNIIAGETYAEPTGNITIKSSNGYKAVAEFAKGGMWSGRSEEVIVKAFDNNKKELTYTVNGTWTENFKLKTNSTEKSIWQVGELLPNYQKKYGFTTFAGTLNKITELEKGFIPPTDSRYRPDLQAYEKGDVNTAEELKNKLEQDQRVRRKQLEESGQEHIPQFFKFVGNGPVDEGKWEFITGEKSYWNRRKNQDWNGLVQLW
ncbi:OSH3 [Candida pseudojiufengensis]|uniref:OSH3 n=1 Tax=Candida pseudojiufengensis TaxID=497109 RepID=UPI002224ADC1|nr:OSH3 [Candida pseudojiufengensis]KAI5965617.1 OSH3 [Candida pseudojiufengensis]